VVFFGVLAAPGSTCSLSPYRRAPRPRFSYPDVWLNPMASYRFASRDLNLRSKPIGGNSALVSEAETRFNKLTLLESALAKIPSVTRLESALANSLNLKPFRIRTYKKRWGEGANGQPRQSRARPDGRHRIGSATSRSLTGVRDGNPSSRCQLCFMNSPLVLVSELYRVSVKTSVLTKSPENLLHGASTFSCFI
jgi:hypothetical protein